MKTLSPNVQKVGLFGVLFLGAVAGPIAHANDIDLIHNSSGYDDQGTFFNRSTLQPTGSGVIDPFLTIQQKGSERGYNTDATAGNLLDDTRIHTDYVRAVKLDDIAGHTIQGLTGVYAEFFLDINEDNGSGQYLSLNKLQLFSTSDPNITGYTETNSLTGMSTDGFANATMLYDLDRTTDYTVQLDYNLASGSGSGDLFVYIPYSFLQSEVGKGKYLVMYSAFGNPYKAKSGLYASSAGYEEWRYVSGTHPGPPTPGPGLPLPSTAASGAVILGAISFGRRSRKPA